MKIIRYKSGNFAQTVELLKKSKNAVSLPSEKYYEIARLFEEAEANKSTLNGLFLKTYTVLVFENDMPVGIASMDGDGSVGIFATSAGETFTKACKSLSDALDRRAVKKDISMLTVLPTDGSAGLFKKLRYETFDAATGEFGVADEFMLVKKIKTQNEHDLSPEQAKKLVLDPSGKITVEGKVSVFPVIFFAVACFFVFLLIIISVTKYEPSQLKKFLIFDIIFGLFFAVASGIFIAYLVRGARLKKKVLSMNVTNGVIAALEESVFREMGDFRARRKTGRVVRCSYVSITYVFYDLNGKRREERFKHRYNGESPYFYTGQELVVAYDESESFILRKYTLVGNADEEPRGTETERDCGGGESARYAEEKELLKYVPVNGIKIYFVIAALFWSVFVIEIIVTLILSAFVAARSDLTFGGQMLAFWPLHLFSFTVSGITGATFAIIPLSARKKYKQLVCRPGVIICEGKIVCSAQTYRGNEKAAFFCEYKAGGEKRKIRVPKTIASSMVKRGVTDVRVVYDKTAAIVVVEKGKFPDRLKK